MRESEFYTGIKPLTVAKTKKLFKEAYAAAFDVITEIKDDDYKRIRAYISFEEMLKKFNKKCHFYFVNRFNPPNENFIEIGFCTMGKKNDYFLWLNVERDMYLEHFIDKYKLKLL